MKLIQVFLLVLILGVLFVHLYSQGEQEEHLKNIEYVLYEQLLYMGEDEGWEDGFVEAQWSPDTIVRDQKHYSETECGLEMRRKDIAIKVLRGRIAELQTRIYRLKEAETKELRSRSYQ